MITALIFIVIVSICEGIAWYSGMDVFKRGSDQAALLVFAIFSAGLLAPLIGPIFNSRD